MPNPIGPSLFNFIDMIRKRVYNWSTLKRPPIPHSFVLAGEILSAEVQWSSKRLILYPFNQGQDFFFLTWADLSNCSCKSDNLEIKSSFYINQMFLLKHSEFKLNRAAWEHKLFSLVHGCRTEIFCSKSDIIKLLNLHELVFMVPFELPNLNLNWVAWPLIYIRRLHTHQKRKMPPWENDIDKWILDGQETVSFSRRIFWGRFREDSTRVSRHTPLTTRLLCCIAGLLSFWMNTESVNSVLQKTRRKT